MKQTEALKLALEALDNLMYWDNGKPDYDDAREAITAIKEALAQPDENKSALSLYESGFIDGREKGLKEAQPEQEPVAWRWENAGKDKWLNKYIYLDNGAPDYPEKCEPLYTTSPQRTWVGLTDEEIYEATKDLDTKPLRVIVDLLEAKLKQKNGYAEEKNT